MPKQAGPAEWQWLADELKQLFPWLGTDEAANGADVIDGVNTLYSEAMRHVRPAKHYYPGTPVVYQGCLWKVLWCDGVQVGIQSCGGTEAITVKVEAVEPAPHDGMMTRELFDKIMEEQG